MSTVSVFSVVSLAVVNAFSCQIVIRAIMGSLPGKILLCIDERIPCEGVMRPCSRFICGCGFGGRAES